MEYSGYSIYKGATSSETIKEDSLYVYNYVVNKLGFKQQNIIVMGRSIGTGIALELMQKVNPGALVLISPFASIKSLASEFIGFLGQLFAKETYDNRVNIQTVTCPTFFLHGRKDEVISVENSNELSSTPAFT
jgi:acetyl esterase/lipase